MIAWPDCKDPLILAPHGVACKPWFMSVEKAVLGLWQALSGRDWAAVKTFLSTDCIYVDMPVGATLAARGPGDIVK
jgi:hypothetical protein